LHFHSGVREHGPRYPPVARRSNSRTQVSTATAKLRLLKRLRCTLRYEKKAWDSKLLLAPRREVLADRIREHAVAWAVAAVDAARIDQINIYQASRLAMKMAVTKLLPAPDYLLIDAVRLDCELPQKPIIHGDALSASIAAASILAKVERDRMVSKWDPVFPVYGLASNKGYSTPHHLAALREHGPSPLHRQSFAPVWNAPVPQEVLSFMLEEKASAEEGMLEEVADG